MRILQEIFEMVQLGDRLGPLVVGLLFVADASGCGIILHTEIAERASQFFSLTSEGVDYNALMRRHPDALQAGAPYPDAFYSGLCFNGDYHQVSEDTHWTPFLNATVNYIRKTYPKPWDRFAEKLVVFLLGVVQHQVADVNWHSLGIDEGFLDTMGKINYHGSFSEAHSDGDVGGDILMLFETDTNYIGVVTKWYVPTDDLVKIYEELYGQPDRMNREVIENCTMLLFLGRLGESLGVIDLLYPTVARNSPFILDRFTDYFLGGVDDMAVWSGNVWNRTITMLEKGTSACDLPNNPIYIRCNGTDANKSDRRYHQRTAARLKNPGTRVNQDWNLNEADVLVQRSAHGIYLSTAEPLEQLMYKKQAMRSIVEPFLCNGTCQSPNVYFQTAQQYSRLGKQIISGDVNGDGLLDVVISAPGYSGPGNYQAGRVYVIYGTADGIPETDADIETISDLVLTGPELNGRFGTAVTVVDFDADGLNDLAISAPSVGSVTLEYRGQVYVYLNDRLNGISLIPSITIDCTERYCNFGWTLESGDLNGDGFDDLLIGSPFAPSGGRQRGSVGAFFSSPFYQVGARLTQLDFDFSWAGTQDYEWFGFSVSLGWIGPESWLVVGAPTYRICSEPGCGYSTTDVQSVGRVYTFRSGVLIQSFSGQEEFEQFGFAVRVAHWNGADVVIASSVSGSSTENVFQTGVVKVFEVKTGEIQPEPVLVLHGDREYSRFGSTILVFTSAFDGKSSLLITAPYRSEDLRTDRESGRVFLYQNMTSGVDGVQADRIFGMPVAQARCGSSVAVIPSQNKVQLVIGAEHYTAVSRLGGAVGVFDL